MQDATAYGLQLGLPAQETLSAYNAAIIRKRIVEVEGHCYGLKPEQQNRNQGNLAGKRRRYNRFSAVTTASLR